jgi:hypothetical protein
MNHRLSLIFIPWGLLLGSCFVQQEAAPQEMIQQQQQPDAGDPNTQCVNESAECFSMCGAPECALADATIPPFLDVPVIWYQPGGSVNNVGSPAPGTSTADPCVAINDASLVIRRRSCGACHGPSPAPGLGHFNYVLDDTTLANHPDNSVDGKIMVIPGDPEGSYVYQRIITGLAGAGSGGMPPDQSTLPTYLGASAAAQNPVVYPTAADVSVLHTWILNCMTGANKDAYQANYGSGSFGSNPSPDAGTGGD